MATKSNPPYKFNRLHFLLCFWAAAGVLFGLKCAFPEIAGEKLEEVKERIVEQDPTEKGIRKALNLGHTIGHAFESLALAEERTVLHGYAVAWGMICELYLSAVRMHFPHDVLQQALTFVRENYGTFLIDCKEYDRLYDYMTHDKKNLSAGQVNFTLLSDVGDIHIDQIASKDEIFEALDFYRDSMGC